MATIKTHLTVNWILIGDTSMLLQRQGSRQNVIEITNDTDIPTDPDVPVHNLFPEVGLILPAPAVGNWYGRVRSGEADLVSTAI